MKSTSAMVPSWLENLLSTRFFSLCNVHKKQSRNECKMFCLDCNNEAYCAHCIAYSHEKHRVVQIRRSSYHDVVRVKEIENALNITGIQTYRINGYQLVWTKTSEKESIPIEGVSRTMLSQSAQLPTTAVPTPSNANSRKRKGTPCRAAS
ncbi:hypothetical protein AHAS_Ahas08G0086200 [Arachis hypogaea]|uniref:B box-type domain-containing protein n=1 Tax=Arachis hypogaea TaxID=3818 RepID=A0A445BW52_ARAHY|nr:hypothetical protein Ahy_A08g039397 [Arachis hypogaea]